MTAEKAKAITTKQHERACKGVEYQAGKDSVQYSPIAYKDIDKVIKSQQDLVTVKHTLNPILNIRG